MSEPTSNSNGDAAATVSCIIPLYNRAHMLEACVDSVLRQTHRPLEIVLVDDGSQDETPAAAQRLADLHPGVVKFIRQENGGPGAARQTGLRHATGEFIQYLDSDDLLEPRKFELQVRRFRECPDADVCYCITLRQHAASGSERPWARTAEVIERIFPDFLIQRGWHTITPLWRKRIYDRFPGWSNLRAMEDWEHDLKAGMAGAAVCQAAEPLARVIDHSGERASGMGTGFTPQLTRNYFLAHESIWLEMRDRGLVDREYTEMFSRKLFWLARLCGERGLRDEADRALSYAREMITPYRSSVGLRAFQTATRCFGWPMTVRAAEAVRRLLKTPAGAAEKP
ncbi:MAG: glycosyltransferase [Planctomyces sp.]|nr:glycosyltransferase [Planctomyces sp.]